MNIDDFFPERRDSRSSAAVTSDSESPAPENVTPDNSLLSDPEPHGLNSDEHYISTPFLESIEDEAGLTQLRTTTLNQLAETLVNDEITDHDILQQAEMLPDFWPKVKEILYQKANKLKVSSKSLELLYQSLKQDIFVDLSLF